jgi:hypothetical protein
MSVNLASALLLMSQDPSTPVVSLCDIARGTVAPDTDVEVEGRFLTDFLHASVLRQDDCQVFINIRPEIDGGEAFFDAVVRVNPKPDLDRTNLTVRVRGRVRPFDLPLISDAQAPGIEASEVLEMRVQEDADQ